MKKYLFYIVKYVRWIYSLYFYLGSFALKVLKIFVRPDDRLILFSSFGGRKFDDSPRAIYEAMIRDCRFKEYKFVWAFIDPDKIDVPKGTKVKCDTLRYFITALKARVWVTNSSIERGLDFKGKHTFYFDTWHGTPLKKMGSDIDMASKTFRGKGRWDVDVFTVQGEFEAEVFARAFKIKEDAISMIGLPRNDIYQKYTKEYADGLRKKLNIPMDKKVILYAPTFREFESGHGGERVLHVPMTLTKWKELLVEDYVLLFRAHYEVAKSMNIEDDEFVRGMSAYPQLEDLMIVSDMLISDYSSMFFDYSIMHKPMLCFCYDYDKYAKERGMYFDIRDYLPNADNEDDLIKLIQNTDTTKQNAATKKFQEHFVTEYGSAAQKSIDIIYNAIK